MRAAALATVAVVALAACERFEQKDPLPTYHDSKLDVMRPVTDQPLPTSHESNAMRADAAPTASAAPASAARP